MAPPNNQNLPRHSNKKVDTVHIHIINNVNASVEHTIPRSLIRSSAVLLAHPHAPIIHFYWHGTLGVFDMYRAWLQTHKVLTNSEVASKDPSAGTTQSDYVALICCWGMGQTLRDTVYQDMVMSSIIERIHAWTGPGTVPFIYALKSPVILTLYHQTSVDAPLRRLVVDLAAKLGREEDFQHFKQDTAYPLAFITDLMVALGREKDRPSALGQSVRRNHLELGTFLFPLPPPPPPPRRRVPTPFFSFEAELAGTQNPRSILRGRSISSPGRISKQVRFEGEGTVLVGDDCVYHLHRQIGAPCWRTRG
ncbi:Nn.00g001060.m01.CDS01 [Neocucurbitaria sp. VM-36]